MAKSAECWSSRVHSFDPRIRLYEIALFSQISGREYPWLICLFLEPFLESASGLFFAFFRRRVLVRLFSTSLFFFISAWGNLVDDVILVGGGVFAIPFSWKSIILQTFTIAYISLKRLFYPRALSGKNATFSLLGDRISACHRLEGAEGGSSTCYGRSIGCRFI